MPTFAVVAQLRAALPDGAHVRGEFDRAACHPKPVSTVCTHIVVAKIRLSACAQRLGLTA
jgi:hypothetical protein